MRHPPFFCYFGHHRSASTYIQHVIRGVCAELQWPVSITHAARTPRDWVGVPRPGARPRFLVYTNADASLLRALDGCRGFHVIRDPRDVVVSSYFSHLYSHPTDEWQALAGHRRQLEALSKEEGLLYEIETCRREQFAAMYEWNYSSPGVLEVRMEELVRSPGDEFLRIFRFLGVVGNEPAGRVGLRLARFANRVLVRAGNAVSVRARGRSLATPVGFPLDRIPPERLQAIVMRHDFVRKTRGRPAGEEDVWSHYRKGVAGDWRNHFTDAHIRAFKANYSGLLVKLGYEVDDRW